MVFTYISDITPLFREAVYERYYHLLPVSRREKADRMKQKLNKCQSVGVYSLYLEVLKRMENGEESVYNFSHSGNYVICSINQGVDSFVGCDIEMIRKINMKLIHRYYNKEEIHYVENGKDEREKMSRLIHIWTVKESYMKALRLGTNLSTKSFTSAFDEKCIPVLVKQPKEYEEKVEFQSVLYKERAWITICSNEDIDKNIKVIDL